ncbi:MAG: sigma 54-interacting transcriptional regulator, partial [Bilophila sp.]
MRLSRVSVESLFKVSLLELLNQPEGLPFSLQTCGRNRFQCLLKRPKMAPVQARVFTEPSVAPPDVISLNTLHFGDSRVEKAVRQAERLLEKDIPLLIQGETGVGKEVFVKALHQASSRNKQAFIAVNCAAIPAELVESELFGYEKGAFTGAAKGGKPGMFELAHKGTLLLDEIGELPLPMQAKLLQVLDGHPFHRVGGTKPIVVDVRVLAATNKPLAEMVSGGQFREDLFYRLRVLTVEIPPLRERTDDIPVLAMHFLQEIAAKNALNKKFDPLVLNCFLTYPWPGNVRELQNLMERAVLLAGGKEITPRHFLLNENEWPLFDESDESDAFETAGTAASEAEQGGGVASAKDGTGEQGSSGSGTPFPNAVIPLHEMERLMIMKGLETTSGNRTQAAELLGISVRTLRNKLNEYRGLGMDIA